MASPKDLPRYYRALLKHYGPRHWWPAETPFEVMVGAILTQNTAWTNVEKAIHNLKAAGMLEPRPIAEADAATLARLIRPAGYFNVKARRLQDFVRWFVERWRGDVRIMRLVPPERMREELLDVKGIGPETADSILLYALEHPVFVVDAYTFRVLHRHGFVGEEATYDEMKEIFEGTVPRDAALFNDFHAQIVNVGKDFCRATPRCEKCPLRKFLPG
ncbi:MAG: endonuclease III domain-containing protein [Planctomycetes bacterium]|nr:endonuclease III domain-containing protein [Planctomycetota bacterium]